MDASVERSRSGVRSWVRAAGSGLRRAGPYGILAFLSASAVAPVAGAALGAPAEFSVALGQLGNMGGNYLADALAGTAARLAARPGEPTEDEWRDAVATDLLARLTDGDTALRDELAELLRTVGAVEVALRAADDRSRQQLADAFDELQVLAVDTRRVLDDIRRGLTEQVETQRRDTGRVLGALAATTALVRSLRPPGDEPRPAAPPADGIAPYPGLASFDVGDAAFFHGREELVRQLLGGLDEHLLGGPPVVVVGASGAGKSSLLRAGLWPAVAADGLGEGSGAWPWVFLTPGTTPLAGLRAALGSERPAGGSAGQRRIVVVDQFEELFTQCADPAERSAFVTALASIPDALLIIAVRADFYPQCIELAPMAALLGRGQIVVAPPTPDELRRAIVEPARAAGLAVEPGLVEVLLRDYRPGALPLLAHALRATWERREGGTLTVAGYHATGGIRRAVAETAERVYAGLDQSGRASLRSELLGLVTDVDGRAVRRRAPRAEVDMAVLGAFVERRLITVGTDTVEISHEALLDGWPRLAGWLVDAREEILLRQRLAQAAHDWAGGGEDPDALFQGVRLAAAQEWAAGGADLPEPQRRFLAASSAAAEARQIAQRRNTRRLRRLVAGLAVALLLVVAGGLVALDQRGRARDNWSLALSRQRAAESRTEYHTQPLSSVDKALAAWRAAPTFEARSSLLSAQQTRMTTRLGSRTGAQSVAVSPDGGIVAAGYPSGEIELWDTTTLQRIGPALRHPTDQLTFLHFSPDGRFLASGAYQVNGIMVWEVPSGTLRQRLPGFGEPAWLPDSSAVLAARSDQPALAIGAWDPASGRRTASFGIPTGGASLSVSSRGTYVAVGGGAGGGVLVRRADGAVLARLPNAYMVRFAADDTLFSTGRTVGSAVEARRPGDGWRAVPVPDPNDEVQPAAPGKFAVTPDGTVIKGSGDVGEVLLLTVGGPRPGLTGLRGLPSDLAVAAEGRLLAMAGDRDEPTLVRLGGVALSHPQAVGHIAVAPDGLRLATGSSDPAIRIWDPATGELRSMIRLAADDGPLGLGFAPDGSLAATVNQGGRVLLFDPRERLRHTFTIDPALFPAGVTFSPDGSMVAVVVNARTTNDPRNQSFDIQRATDPDVIVWDTRTLRQRAVLRVPGAISSAAGFTPDGRHLLITANRVIERSRSLQAGSIWRFRTADLTLADSWESPREHLEEIAVSPDSATVAVAVGTSIRLLRVDGFTPVRDLVRNHPVPVTRVAWAPDGRSLAGGTDDDDGSVQLWNADGTPIAELRGNSNQWGPLHFSPDGRMLVAGLNDWTVGIWRLDPDEVIPRLCAASTPSHRVAGDSPPELCGTG